LLRRFTHEESHIVKVEKISIIPTFWYDAFFILDFNPLSSRPRQFRKLSLAQMAELLLMPLIERARQNYTSGHSSKQVIASLSLFGLRGLSHRT